MPYVRACRFVIDDVILARRTDVDEINPLRLKSCRSRSSSLGCALRANAYILLDVAGSQRENPRAARLLRLLTLLNYHGHEQRSNSLPIVTFGKGVSCALLKCVDHRHGGFFAVMDGKRGDLIGRYSIICSQLLHWRRWIFVEGDAFDVDTWLRT